MPAAMHVAFPDVASSSHTIPPSMPEANYSQIMEALAAIQGGMSTMQQSISSLQLEVRSINKRVEQTHLDLLECLRVHHPGSSDDEDDAAWTVHMLEDFWVSLCFIGSFCVILRLFVIFCYFVKHLNLYYSVS